MCLWENKAISKRRSGRSLGFVLPRTRVFALRSEIDGLPIVCILALLVHLVIPNRFEVRTVHSLAQICLQIGYALEASHRIRTVQLSQNPKNVLDVLVIRNQQRKLQRHQSTDTQFPRFYTSVSLAITLSGSTPNSTSSSCSIVFKASFSTLGSAKIDYSPHPQLRKAGWICTKSAGSPRTQSSDSLCLRATIESPRAKPTP